MRGLMQVLNKKRPENIHFSTFPGLYKIIIYLSQIILDHNYGHCDHIVCYSDGYSFCYFYGRCNVLLFRYPCKLLLEEALVLLQSLLEVVHNDTRIHTRFHLYIHYHNPGRATCKYRMKY